MDDKKQRQLSAEDNGKKSTIMSKNRRKKKTRDNKSKLAITHLNPDINLEEASVSSSQYQATHLVTDDSENIVNKLETLNCASDVYGSSCNYCSECNIPFSNKSNYERHMQLTRHHSKSSAHEEKVWKFRCPPSGVLPFEFTICESYSERKACRLGEKCVEAHGDTELAEWKERYTVNSSNTEKIDCKQWEDSSYAQRLLQKLSTASSNLEKMLSSKVEGVLCTVDSNLTLRVSEKPSEHIWIFHLQLPSDLHVVSLLHDSHRNHFTIKRITRQITNMENKSHIPLYGCFAPCSHVEWVNPNVIEGSKVMTEYKIEIYFRAEIYGTFRQDVVFDFGIEPALKQSLCVDSISLEDYKELESTKKTVITKTEMWCPENTDIVDFEPKDEVDFNALRIMKKYPVPTKENFHINKHSLEKYPTIAHYKERMHDLLTIEEMEHFNLISQFNIRSTLQLADKYLLFPSSASVSKYATFGELYARLPLSSEISEDSPHGRLILNCSSILVSVGVPSHNAQDKGIQKERRKAYEALIEDKTKHEIYIRLSQNTVKELKLQDEEEVTLDIQFRLNRLPMCEMHEGLDRFTCYDLLFPSLTKEPSIPWNPSKHWSSLQDLKLNPKQKEAVLAISAPLDVSLPPILLIGPFGTGKTYTLGQTIKYLVQNFEKARILVCTHSNSAADIYIKDYLHPYFESGNLDSKPLRIYYHKRWVPTVHKTVQKYCLIERNETFQRFRQPTKGDIYSHKIIITTINTSVQLAYLDIPNDFFTHILIDEAAQVMESSTLIPLSLINSKTRVVLAGDHMQLSQEVFSPFCKERGLHVPLLERLYDFYPSDFCCRIMLVENYRSHSAIIQYTSDLFYEGKLVSKGRIVSHPDFHPLTFFTARGQDVQDSSSTTYYNISEVKEVSELVEELVKTWPESNWGLFNEESIGVVTPYMDQVMKIRSELKKKRLGRVSVERVLNVQGKEFRVVILSVVRTRHTCPENDTGLDFGFLSNAKLLTTAITRAQSMVAIVGDPITLCSVGRCRKLWEEYILQCTKAGSIYGITWPEIRSQLDGIELQKIYGLNPNAKEFIPRYSLYPTVIPIMPPSFINPPINPIICNPQNVLPTFPFAYSAAPLIMNAQYPLLQPTSGISPSNLIQSQYPLVFSGPPVTQQVSSISPYTNSSISNSFFGPNPPNPLPRPFYSQPLNMMSHNNQFYNPNYRLPSTINYAMRPPRLQNFNDRHVIVQRTSAPSANPNSSNCNSVVNVPQVAIEKNIKFLNNVHFPSSCERSSDGIRGTSITTTTSPTVQQSSQDNYSQRSSVLVGDLQRVNNPLQSVNYLLQTNNQHQLYQHQSSNLCPNNTNPYSSRNGPSIDAISNNRSSFEEQDICLMESLSKLLNENSPNKENSSYAFNSCTPETLEGIKSNLAPHSEVRNTSSHFHNTAQRTISKDVNSVNLPADERKLSVNSFTSASVVNSPLNQVQVSSSESFKWSDRGKNLMSASLNAHYSDFISNVKLDSYNRLNFFERKNLPLYLRKGNQIAPSSDKTRESVRRGASSGWNQETIACNAHVPETTAPLMTPLHNNTNFIPNNSTNSKTYADALRLFSRHGGGST